MTTIASSIFVHSFVRYIAYLYIQAAHTTQLVAVSLHAITLIQ